MKKLISLTLSAALCLGLFAGCGKQNAPAATETTAPAYYGTVSRYGLIAYASSLEVLEKVWATFPEEDRFPAAGGDEAHDTTDGPGAFDINAYGESFRYQTLVDENLTGKLTGDAATLIHMMNTNTFCSAVMELKNAGEASSFGEIYKEIVQGNHWMCGFPDTLVVLSLGDFVLTAYGADDLIQLFKNGAQSLGATLLVEAPAEA